MDFRSEGKNQDLARFFSRTEGKDSFDPKTGFQGFPAKMGQRGLNLRSARPLRSPKEACKDPFSPLTWEITLATTPLTGNVQVSPLTRKITLATSPRTGGVQVSPRPSRPAASRQSAHLSRVRAGFSPPAENHLGNRALKEGLHRRHETRCGPAVHSVSSSSE